MSSSIVHDKINCFTSCDPMKMLMDAGPDPWHDVQHIVGITGYVFGDCSSSWKSNAHVKVINGKWTIVAVFIGNVVAL